MLHKFKQAGLLMPSFMAVVGVAVLVSLGTWQLQRKAWKDGLQAQIDARASAAAVPLADALQRFDKGEDITYLRVRVRGVYEPGSERYFYAPEKQGPGWLLYTKLRLEQPTGGRRAIYINRGWIPDDVRQHGQAPSLRPSGPVDVVGLVRLQGVKGFFTPDNELGRNNWFWRDIHALHTGGPMAGGGEIAKLSRAAGYVPFVLDAVATGGNAKGWPKAGTTLMRLPNNHLGYALTWFGLAIILVGVFFAFARSRLATTDG